MKCEDYEKVRLFYQLIGNKYHGYCNCEKSWVDIVGEDNKYYGWELTVEIYNMPCSSYHHEPPTEVSLQSKKISQVGGYNKHDIWRRQCCMTPKSNIIQQEKKLKWNYIAFFFSPNWKGDKYKRMVFYPSNLIFCLKIMIKLVGRVWPFPVHSRSSDIFQHNIKKLFFFVMIMF